MKKSLSDYFKDIQDPRRGAGLRTDLDQIMCMVTLSYLCGSCGYRPTANFCKAHHESLTESLSLRHGVPSHVTFREVLHRVDEQALIAAFNAWSQDYVELGPSDWVSSDGKTLNSTVSDCHGSNQDFQAIVSLFCQKSGLVYAIEEYRNKSKEKAEIDLVRFLIGKLDGMGITLTVDALHTQKKQSKPL